MTLHEVPRPIIEHDIRAYLKDAFAEIREEYNLEPTGGVPLADDWPGQPLLQLLTEVAVPLFIVAATIYRFVHGWNPQQQLDTVLRSRKVGQLS